MQPRWEERLLEIGTAALLLGVPLAFGTRLADSVEIPKAAVFLAGAALLLAGWSLGASRGAWPWFRRTAIGLWGGLLGLWWALSGLWSLSPPEAAGPSLQHLLEALVLNAWIASGTPERWWRWWLYALGAGVTVGLYAWLQRLGLDPFAWNHPHLSRERTIATLGNPNYLALYLVAWLPLALGWALSRTQGWRRWLSLGGWLLITAAMVLTTTRGAWLASLVAAGVWLIGLRFAPAGWARWTLGIGIAAAVMLSLLVAVQRGDGSDFSVADRARTFGDESVTVRVFLWRAALGLAAEHPITGIGPASYRYAALPYRHLEPVSARPKQRLPENPHNQILQVACETGLPGLIMLTGWLIATVIALIRRLSNELMALAGLASLAALWTDQLTISADLPASVWWLALSAWAAAAARPGRSEPEPSRGGARGGGWWALPLAAVAVLWAGAWLRAEFLVWWGDEWRIRAGRATQPQHAAREYDLALEHYREALPLAHPGRQAEIWSLLGSLYLETFRRLGAPELARQSLAAYGEACRRSPFNPYYQAYLGQVHQALGQPAEAEEAYRRALRLDPHSPVFWAFLGSAQAAAGRWGDAETSYGESLRNFPDHGGTRMERARALAELKRYVEAEEELEAAVRLDPELDRAADELRRGYGLGKDPPGLR